METENVKALLCDRDGNPTMKYAAYLKYKADYGDRVDKQNTAYSETMQNPMKLHMWPIQGRKYSEDVKDAMNRWVALGFKNEIENAMNILQAQGINIDSVVQKKS